MYWLFFRLGASPKTNALVPLGPTRRTWAAFLLVGALACNSESPPQHSSQRSVSAPYASSEWTKQNALLTPSDPELDFGILPKGSHCFADFSLENLTDTVVEIGPVSTSCECISISLPATRIAPGEIVDATANVNLDENDRGGRLRIEIRAPASGRGLLAFHLWANVEVDGASKAMHP